MADTLSVAGFGLASFAFVCEIISVALPFWMFDEQDGVKVYIGLWIACLDAGSYKTCSSDGGKLYREYVYHGGESRDTTTTTMTDI